MASLRDENRRTDRNPDAITGTAGSHPVGTGIGAAGAGATGALIGSVAGPVGTAVGAVIGAVAGGLAGKGVAEGINPTAEDEYWRDNFSRRPYVAPDSRYEDYAPAYRHGYQARSQYGDTSFEQVESELRSDWERTKGKSRLKWEHAKDAVKDAWDRVSSPSSSPTGSATVSGPSATGMGASDPDKANPEAAGSSQSPGMTNERRPL